MWIPNVYVSSVFFRFINIWLFADNFGSLGTLWRQCCVYNLKSFKIEHDNWTFHAKSGLNTKFPLFIPSLSEDITILRFLGTFGSLGTGWRHGGGEYFENIKSRWISHAKISFHAKFQLSNLFLSEIIRHYMLLILVPFNPYYVKDVQRWCHYRKSLDLQSNRSAATSE